MKNEKESWLSSKLFGGKRGFSSVQVWSKQGCDSGWLKSNLRGAISHPAINFRRTELIPEKNHLLQRSGPRKAVSDFLTLFFYPHFLSTGLPYSCCTTLPLQTISNLSVTGVSSCPWSVVPSDDWQLSLSTTPQTTRLILLTGLHRFSLQSQKGKKMPYVHMGFI